MMDIETWIAGFPFQSSLAVLYRQLQFSETFGDEVFYSTIERNKKFILHSDCIGEVTALPLPNQSEGLILLKRAIDAVSPVLRKRRWRVRSIREFLPRSKTLLGRNWNKGDVIEIRLRVSNSDMSGYVNDITHGSNRVVFFRLKLLSALCCTSWCILFTVRIANHLRDF
jgi:hypothetical protein